jgi:hypothetical protein
MTKVEIRPVEGAADLFMHYQLQTQRQGCYIELDCRSGLLTAEYNSEISNAVPCTVWHGHDQRWPIPLLRGQSANALMDEIAPLAQAVLDGYASVWDGSNLVAHFSPTAQAAIEEIATLCSATEWMDAEHALSEYEAGDWLQECWRDHVRCDLTDDQLHTLAEDLESCALDEGVVLYGTEDYLAERRQILRDEASDEDND